MSPRNISLNQTRSPADVAGANGAGRRSLPCAETAPLIATSLRQHPQRDRSPLHRAPGRPIKRARESSSGPTLLRPSLVQLLLALCACLHAGSLPALEIAGVAVPQIVQGDEGQGRMTLAGHAEVHRHYLPFYGVTLHLPELRPSKAVLVQGLAPCRLSLIWFANGLSAEQVRAYFRERFEIAADDEALGRAKPRIDQLLGMLPGTSRGRTFSFDYDPDRGMLVEVDGERLLALPGVEFNRVLLGLWLGEAAEDGVAEALLTQTR